MDDMTFLQDQCLIAVFSVVGPHKIERYFYIAVLHDAADGCLPRPSGLDIGKNKKSENNLAIVRIEIAGTSKIVVLISCCGRSA